MDLHLLWWACLLLLFLCLFLQLFRLFFPLLFKAVWEFIVDRDLHIGLLLNQNDAVVEVALLEGYTERRVPIEVLCLQLSATLYYVE